MSGTQVGTMVDYLSSLVGVDPADCDYGTVEGRVEAQAALAQRQYRDARQRLTDALTDGDGVRWATERYVVDAVRTEQEAVLWTRAHDTSLLAATYEAATLLGQEMTSTDLTANVMAGVRRAAARQFLTDAIYAARDKDLVDSLRAEAGKVFMR